MDFKMIWISFDRDPEDLVDPQTKLSAHQIRDVQRSWENLRKGRNAMVSGHDQDQVRFLFKILIHLNLKTLNCIIYKRLFKETPRVQKYFAKFGKVPVDSLTGDAIISVMDDKLQLLGNINYMRYTHAARSIPRGPWEVISEFLNSLLSDVWFIIFDV